jgi:hypothetical protein
MKDFQTTGETSRVQPSKDNIYRYGSKSKHEILNFFFSVVNFVFLKPDPDSESGSKHPIESASNPDPNPDPKHCLQ